MTASPAPRGSYMYPSNPRVGPHPYYSLPTRSRLSRGPYAQMEQTQTCPYCEMPAVKLSRCGGCKKAVYCSKACQKEAWPSHIFDCKPGQPINTAYRLYKACLGDVIPDDPETRRDYGFAKAARTMGGRSENMLCGLYKGFLLYIDAVTPKDVHRWRLEGRLVQEIKDAFERIPVQSRGGYYPWFLEHQSLLDDAVPDDDQLIINHVSETIRSAWIMTGGSPSDSLNVIDTKLRNLPPPRQACHILYRGLVNGGHPNPCQDLWIDFGFVATMNNTEERDLGVAYRALIEVCKFEEFCVAHETSSIPALLERYGLQCTRLFRDVMAHAPYRRKSVWDLKHYVDQLPGESTEDVAIKMVPSVSVDYGYKNCRDGADRKRLDTAYKGYFSLPQADPLDLHEACIGGRLLEHLAPLMHWTKAEKKTYARLLKTVYPLPQTVDYAGITYNGDTIVIFNADRTVPPVVLGGSSGNPSC